MGNGAPTIGSMPKTIAMLTNTYKKIAVAKPKQYNCLLYTSDAADE